MNGRIFVVKCTRALRALVLGSLLSTAGATSTLASAQATDAEIKYSALLQQIADQRMALMQSEVFDAKQKAQIEELRSEIGKVSEAKKTIDPLLSKMAAQMEDAINSDLPFLREERLNRINKLKNDLGNSEIRVADKYRAALNAYKIEVNYGMAVDGYKGPIPLNAGEAPVLVVPLDDKGEPLREANNEIMPPEAELGTYLRYGRVALVWLNQRNTKARRYDAPTKAWVDVSGGELNDIRKAVRVSRGEVAPSVLMVPTHLAQ